MSNFENEVVLRKDDYNRLMSYLRSAPQQTPTDRKYARELEAELRRARIVDKENFPSDVVRLNSRVRLRGISRDKVMEIVLVSPEQADIRLGKISILAPLGTALIGFRRGAHVQWPTPSGLATFVILDVVNERER